MLYFLVLSCFFTVDMAFFTHENLATLLSYNGPILLLLSL